MSKRTKHHRDRDNIVRVLDDEKKQALYLDDFKLEVPSVGVFDEPYKCYMINDQWAKIVMGLIGWLATVAPWKDAEEENHDGIIGILKFLSQSGACPMLQVRQSPSEPCVLDYSVDQGETWVTFADIRSCLEAPYDITDYINKLSQSPLFADLVTDIAENADGNVLPATPTVEEPDILCDSAYYIADKIIAFVYQTLQDAQTITLEEFLSGLLGLGGFEGSLLKQFWDLIVANSYPNLMSDVTNSRHFIAKHLYCNELDKDLFILDVDADVEIGDEAQAAIIGATRAITDGKWSLWAFVGSQVDAGEDCSAFCPQPWEYTIDFTLDSGAADGWQLGAWGDTWVSGKGWRWETNITTYRQQLLILENSFGVDATVTFVEYEIVNEGSNSNYCVGGFSNNNATILRLNGVQVFRQNFYTDGQPSSGIYNQLDDVNGHLCDYIQLTGNPCVLSPDRSYLANVTIRGIGVNPFA